MDGLFEKPAMDKKPDMSGQVKVDLSMLPKGVKAGDTFTVSSVDEATKCAYLEPENEAVEPEVQEEGDGETPEAEEAEPKAGVGLNTDTLLGPMGKLKNYLAQKSVDNQSRG